MLPDQGGTASITLPDIITVGVMGRPRADLALTFDANLVLWSTYDRIDINFQTAPDRAIVSERPQHLHAARRRRLDVPGALAGAAPARRPHLRSRRDPVDATSVPACPTPIASTSRSAPATAAATSAATSATCWSSSCPPTPPGQEGPVGTYNTIAHLLGVTLTASWP